jgi:hypothetical protein
MESDHRKSTGQTRRRFTKEEDSKLIRLVRQLGAHNWAAVSSGMTGRTARQCRQRYSNFLSQIRQRSPWTPKEDEFVVTKYRELGPKWVFISTFLPGRTGNDIKNRWHTRLAARCLASDASGSTDTEASPAESVDVTPSEAERAALPPMFGVRPPLSPFLQFVLN